jgi:hypothetical protein
MEGSKCLADIKKNGKDKESLEYILKTWFKTMQKNEGGLERVEYKDKKFQKEQMEKLRKCISMFKNAVKNGDKWDHVNVKGIDSSGAELLYDKKGKLIKKKKKLTFNAEHTEAYFQPDQ